MGRERDAAGKEVGIRVVVDFLEKLLIRVLDERVGFGNRQLVLQKHFDYIVSAESERVQVQAQPFEVFFGDLEAPLLLTEQLPEVCFRVSANGSKNQSIIQLLEHL